MTAKRCTVCGAGTYLQRACTTTTDAECATCTVCLAGSYASAACTGTSNAFCSQCKTCGAQERTTAFCATGLLDGEQSQQLGTNTQCVACSSVDLTLGGVCNKCPAGTVLSAGICQRCATGSYSNGSACLLCAAGKYNDVVGQIGGGACQPCGSGSYAALAGQARCADCPTGTYQESEGGTTCTRCPLYTGNTGTGNIANGSCTRCGTDPMPPIYQNSTLQCVACRAGHFCSLRDNMYVEQRCSTCAGGTYASENCTAWKDTVCSACTACGPGTFTSVVCAPFRNAACMTCTECQPAPYEHTGALCTPGAFDALGQQQLGVDTQCIACNASAGDTRPGAVCNLCPSGSKAEGGQCVKCQRNYYEEGGACVPCPSGTVSEGGTDTCAPVGLSMGQGLQPVAQGGTLGPTFTSAAFYAEHTLVSHGTKVYSLPPSLVLDAGALIAELMQLDVWLLVATQEGGLQRYELAATTQGLQKRSATTLLAGGGRYQGMCRLGNGSVLLLRSSNTTVRVSTTTWEVVVSNGHAGARGVQPWTQPDSYLVWDLTSVRVQPSNETLLRFPAGEHPTDLLARTPEEVYWISEAGVSRWTSGVVAEAADATRVLGLQGGIFLIVGNKVFRLLQAEDCRCPAGTYCSAQNACVKAPVGTYAPGFELAPFFCPRGYAGTGPGQSSFAAGCKPCPPNQYTPSEGSAVCAPLAMQATCPELFDPLSGSCVPCPPGMGGPAPCARCNTTSYYSEGCKPCPAGQTTLPGAFRCQAPGSTGVAREWTTGVVSLSASQDAVVVAEASGAVTACRLQCEVLLRAAPHRNVLLLGDALYGVPTQLQGCVTTSRGGADWAPLAGTCGQPGDSDTLLGEVVDMVGALQATQLVVSTLYPCAALRVVDLKSHVIRNLLHWDVGRSPLYTVERCGKVPLLVGSFDRWLFVAEAQNVYKLDLTATAASTPSRLLATEAPIRLLHVQPHTGFVALYTTANTTSSGFLAQSSNAVFANAEPMGSGQVLAASVGSTLLWTLSGQTTMRARPLPNVTAAQLCEPGYVLLAAACLQVPVGYWSVSQNYADLIACSAGTYGPRAGGTTLAGACLPCPPGTFTADEAQSACERCPPDRPLQTAARTGCTDACATGSVRVGGRACVACDAGYSVPAGAASLAAQCAPCPAGSYSNSSTHFTCLPCAAGWSSPQGASHCIVNCAGTRKCGNDQAPCVDATNDLKMLNSVLLPKGVPATAVVALPGGGVVYSDGGNLYRFVDSCQGTEETCTMEGSPLLTPGDFGSIQALAATADGGTLFFAEPNALYRLAGASPPQRIAGTGASDYCTASAPNALLARFRAVTDLEVDATRVYVCDWLCDSIRVVDLQSGALSTLVAGGTQFQPGSIRPTCTTGCGSLFRPKGIALSSAHLYVTQPEHMAGGVVRVDLAQQTLEPLCAQTTTSAPQQPYEQGCTLWQTCPLYRATDVLYTPHLLGETLLVSTLIGVTRINLGDRSCVQLAGTFFGVNSNARGDQTGVWQPPPWVTPSTTDEPNSKLSSPMHVALNEVKGVLYVGDWLNSKVRRIYIDGRCLCAPGSVYVEATQSCYRADALPALCPLGQYFSSAAQSCVTCGAGDAGQLACAAGLPAQQLKYSFTPQIMQRPQVPGTSDWYGEASDGTVKPSCLLPTCTASAFEIARDAQTVYLPRERAPNRQHFVTLTFQGGQWLPEQSSALQPVCTLPGLWFPCMPADALSPTAARCFLSIGFFTPPGSVLQHWEQHRWEAHTYGGRLLHFDAGAWDYNGTVRGLVGERVATFSRYMLAAPYLWHETSDPLQLGGLHTLPLKQGYVGWPAAHACPDGYMWVGLPTSQNTPNAPVACLSCLPGTYSRRTDGWVGGPYRCEPCLPGSYSADAGASECAPCPLHWFSTGGGPCQPCSNGSITHFAGASACVLCVPGTGSCDACQPGEYQPLAGELTCLQCDAGTYSNATNSRYCTPCAADRYQPLVGQTACTRCPALQQSAVGSLACAACALQCPLDCAGLRCGSNRWLNVATYECVACDAGKLSANPCAYAEESCESAPPGLYLPPNATEIVACPSGQQASPSRASCVACPDGQWSDQVSGEGCSPGRCPRGHRCANGTLAACAPGSYASAPGASACAQCEAGTAAAGEASLVCAACARGRYAPGPNLTQCLLCPAGKYASGTGASACAACDVQRRYYSRAGAAECTLCENGTFDSANDTCTPCGLGRYSLAQQCRDCPAGTANLDTLMGTLSNCVRCASPTAYASSGWECTEAPPGTVPNATWSGVSRCPAGRFRNASQTACQGCQVGTYASAAGRSSCTLCEPGLYQPSNGSTACLQCIDTFGVRGVAAQAGSTGCVACAAAGEVPNANGSACVPCAAGRYQVAAGNTYCDVCVGQPNARVGATACAPCALNNQVYNVSLARCAACGAGKLYVANAYTQGGTCQPCSSAGYTGGFYNPSAGASACQRCSQGYRPTADQSGCAPCGAGTGWNALLPSGTCGACAAGKYSSGGLCADCAPGLYSASAAAACQACAAGTYASGKGARACAPCAAGTFSNVSGASACVACDALSFAKGAGSAACTPRRSFCGQDFVVVSVLDPTQDNTCLGCALCQQGQIFVADQAEPVLVTQETQSTLPRCSGSTHEAPFRCVDNVPTAGYRGQAACPPLNSTRMAFVAGPLMSECYVGCMYGTLLMGLKVYPLSPKDDPRANAFVQHNVFTPSGAWDETLCAPCPTGPCKLPGRYRPQGQGASCGPPCLLQPLACREPAGSPFGAGYDNEGCSAACAPPPPGVSYALQGSATLGDANGCAPYFVCQHGYHLTDARDGCEPCDVGNVSAAEYCGGSPWYSLLPPENCTTTMTRSEMCVRCTPVAHGSLAHVACSVVCDPGYYYLNALCLACNESALECPVGMYLDVETCRGSGTAPECKPCRKPSVGQFVFLTSGGRDPEGCRVRCRAGYHTIALDQADAEGYTPLNVSLWIGNVTGCVRCVEGDSRSCASTCSPGQYRNLLVAEGAPRSCLPCRHNSDCPTGWYAPPCWGNETLDVACAPCSPPPPHQRIVPYAVTRNAVPFVAMECPTACVNNYVPVLGAGVCVPCPTASDSPTAMYAYWNASLAPDGSLRSTRCWSCPLGTATRPQDAGLCVPLPGFAAAIRAMDRMRAIVTDGTELFLQNLDNASVAGGGQRRLLSLSQEINVTAAQSSRRLLGSEVVEVVPCGYGTYKSEAGDGDCVPCPGRNTSTAVRGATSAGACQCQHGHYRPVPSVLDCLPCPADTYRALTASEADPCVPCPSPGETTLGTVGNVACACAAGLYRLGRTCVPCPEGAYCPTWTREPQQCFAGATSRAGSKSLEDCACEGNATRLTRAGTGAYYCVPLGPGMRASASGDRIECVPGWRTREQQCYLCPSGSYARADAGGNVVLDATTGLAQCAPCAKGTHSSWEELALGGCTACPPMQTTPAAGATSAAQCACPAPLAMNAAGQCEGCSDRQYATQHDGCLPCPPHSRVGGGRAAAPEDCLCDKGYQLSEGGACEPCPEGTYAAAASRGRCTPCSLVGATSREVGATSVLSCSECLPGYTRRFQLWCTADREL